MISKIISLLKTEDPHNWELAIHLSESLGICKRVAKCLSWLFYERSRFLRIDAFFPDDTIEQAERYIDRLEKCGFDICIEYKHRKYTGMLTDDLIENQSMIIDATIGKGLNKYTLTKSLTVRHCRT